MKAEKLVISTLLEIYSLKACFNKKRVQKTVIFRVLNLIVKVCASTD